jgi:hypothetical protein
MENSSAKAFKGFKGYHVGDGSIDKQNKVHIP